MLHLKKSNYSSSVNESVISNNQDEFTRLWKQFLKKSKLCQDMFAESPVIHEDETLSEVIGFLEACRDRMTDLIEAGSNGFLVFLLLFLFLFYFLYYIIFLFFTLILVNQCLTNEETVRRNLCPIFLVLANIN